MVGVGTLHWKEELNATFFIFAIGPISSTGKSFL
jgi:hypothetical protein